MIRISTIFIAICMVLVAASLGLVLHAVAGFSGTESAIVALTVLTFLILYNAVSMRLRDRSDVGGQIADLSRGTADLARQVAEFGRRLAAVEGRVVSANSASSDRIQAVLGEINELGGLVKQLAISVASHEDLLASGAPPAPPDRPHPESRSEPAIAPEQAAPAARPAPVADAKPAAEAASPSRSQPQLLTAVKNAVEENRLDIYLQPMVTLPQRKVRFYEAVTRLRDDKDQILAADDFKQESDAWIKHNGPVTHAHPAWTSGGLLPARYVIHAVGPVWGSGDEVNKLSDAITGSLRVADGLKCLSIALPAISTGIFGFPKDRAAGITFSAIEKFFTDHSSSAIKTVKIVLFDKSSVDVFLIFWDSKWADKS
jgi:O-acetyl-ADP-ribose deacetylase (regulator of RNase III)